MKSTTFALGSLLATIAIAQPHRHQHFHQKRADAHPVVVTTEWVEVYETEYVTATVWVSPGEKAPASSTAFPSAIPAQFFEPKAPVVAPVPTPSTPSSVEAPPTPKPTSVPAPVIPAPAPIAKVESSAPVVAAPVVKAPAPTTAPVPVVAPIVAPVVAPVAPVVSPVAAPVAAPVDTSSSSSSLAQGTNTGTIFQFGSASAARKLFWENGSCGLSTYFAGKVDPSAVLVAFPESVMKNYGASQNNKLCGKTATLKSRGKTFKVVVADTNVSPEHSIDMTSDAWTFFGQTDGDGSHSDFSITWTITA